MSMTEAMINEPLFDGDSYTIIAWANNQKVINFQRFGLYQGEWLMITKDEHKYFIYKDYYGSCSGCDAYEALDVPQTLTNAKEFAKRYPAFIEIPIETMRNLVRAGTLPSIFPRNIYDNADGADLRSFIFDVVIAVKNEENIDITAADILACRNQEIKQTALKHFGYERFVAEANMEEIARDGEDALLRTGDIVFAYVKDASTSRRYLLRVPPTMTRVREAIAWTFNMTEAEYRPLIET